MRGQSPRPADGAVVRAAVQAEVDRLGPWFHNLNLCGVQTAATHFLGDYPAEYFARYGHALPQDLSGWSVLDIGCNAGFFSFEMRRRHAARVVGLDSDPRYLQQAAFAAEALGMDVELRLGSVFDVASFGETFDLVLFTGVLYHLRHPLLALDLLRRTVVGRLLVFQTMTRGPGAVMPTEPNYAFFDRSPFEHPGYPRLHFVEGSYAGDATNWWIPNRACAEAMVRSAGFSIVGHPDPEVYLCAPNPDIEPPLPNLFERELGG